MQVVRFVLLGLSFLQYILNPYFWEGSFYWFLILVIAFQLLWFYIEKPITRYRMLFIIFVLIILTAVFLPDPPIIIFGLYVIEIRETCSRKQTAAIVILFVFISTIWLAYSEQSPSTAYQIFNIAIIFLCAWIAEQNLTLLMRDQEHYEYLNKQTESAKKNAQILSQIDTMQEIYTLNERNRISRDLHDSVGHTLSTIVIQLAALEKITIQTSPEASKMLGELHTFTKDGLQNVREVIHEMKPSDYQKLVFVEQLKSMLTKFEENSQITVYFNMNEVKWALTEQQEGVVYRAVQEFLGNTSKHSGASEIRIQYHFTPTNLLLTMSDNGKGTEKIEAKMGLNGMKERAKLLGGKVKVNSSPGAGFTIQLVLPKGGFAYD